MPCRADTPDSEIFEEAMADVERLSTDREQTRHVPEPLYRTPVMISQREREVLRELDQLVSGEAQFDLPDSDEYMEGSVPGLDRRTLRRLHRGEFTLEAELDLHGQTVAAARIAVERFVVDAHSRGLRCIRIVHGRGRNSPGRVPVLKQSLPRWLARGPARQIVLGFTTAAARDGGAGATYVLLRKHGRPLRRDSL